MGRSERIAAQFRNRVKAERDRHGWSQAEMAKRLSDNGIDLHPTTIHKIEKGDRTVRVDEAVGIAELFGVSLDALLGRKASRDDDLLYALRSVLETAQHSAWQVQTAETTMRERAGELAALGGQDDLIAKCDSACVALGEAAQALAAVQEWPGSTAVTRNTRRLLRAMLDADDQAERGNE
ncbi:helix-turn-helix transcriptional regulator [Mycobacterium sp. WMMD1722]|uniref:helix-turn-helix transcriptional regulator n=1 Tax=Mycobacterium sp. WMMD1722 TaxID=3404117 RepID=UPI003BF4DBA2